MSRHANDPLRTTDLSPAQGVPEPTIDAARSTRVGTGPLPVRGYEILDELGRGGMGVVYRARQIKANRVVALKMILSGGHAGDADLTRFRTEAQAIAALNHPNIVQVYEVDEHDGLPFFSLEFCGGGSLDRKLAGTPLPPLEAARLVETLARAMDAAHRANVIHRDLKPANVLLTGEPAASAAGLGTPKITDFGLAKKLDDASGKTQDGDIMGTPSYMAPEQARGQSKDLGPAADIYALGAILYECLTGRPPFKAATTMDTLLQVIGDEPVPPSQLQSKTPRDLETICLACLRKEPAKRYATAAALAEDLRRYQEGRPISKRPVGRLERGWRWCKRNPAVASLLTAVLLVFAVGATVSSLLALAATAARGDAEEKAWTAQQSEAAAVAARNDLETANAALLKSTDSLVTSMARSLLRPLALQAKPLQPLPPLSEPEIGSLWELASSDDRLRLRFVAEALRDPASTRQLKDRRAVALQAAVGLKGTLRSEIEELFRKSLAIQGLPQDQQEDLALCLAQLGILDQQLAWKTSVILTQGMSKTTDQTVLVSLSQGLSMVVARLEPKTAARVARSLIQVLRETTHPKTLQLLSMALSDLASSLEPDELALAAASLTEIIERGTDLDAVVSAAQGLSAVTARLEPGVGRRVRAKCSNLLIRNLLKANVLAWQALPKALSALGSREPEEAALSLTQAMLEPGFKAGQSLSLGLQSLAGRLEPKAAAQIASSLTQGLHTARDPIFLQELTRCLPALAARMDAKEADVICGKGANALTQGMRTTTFPLSLRESSRLLSALAAHLEPIKAMVLCEQAAARLTETRLRTTDPTDLVRLSEALSALAVHMEPKSAAIVADTLSALISPTRPVEVRSLSNCLVEVTTRMDPMEAAAILIQALSKTDPDSLSNGLSRLALRMEPKEAAQAADLLSQALVKATDNIALIQLPSVLATIAARMEPMAAGTLLIHVMSKKPQYNVLASLSGALPEIVVRMDPEEAAVVCDQAATILTKAIYQQDNWGASELLASKLSAVTAHMEPRAAAAILLQTMNKLYNGPWRQLSEGLSAVAVRLKPDEAAVACGQAAAKVSQALTNGHGTAWGTWRDNALALSALAGRMKATDACDVCRKAAASLVLTMRGALGMVTHPQTLEALAEGLSAVTAHLEPKEAAQVCGQAASILTQAMSKTVDPTTLSSLARGLAVLAARLEPKDAVALLTQTMSKTTGSYALVFLTRGLAGVAAKLEPNDAAAVYRQTAATITRALGGETESGASLSTSLLAMTTRLEPKEAAITLIQAMSKLPDSSPFPAKELSAGLSIVLAQETPDAVRQRSLSVTRTVAGLTGPHRPFAILACVRPCLEPIPPPLAAQTLVDILKQPFCVGESRRLVLNQLARHYHRPFVDQWDFVDYVHQHKLDLDLTTAPSGSEFNGRAPLPLGQIK